jgi:hypothetical protein
VPVAAPSTQQSAQRHTKRLQGLRSVGIKKAARESSFSKARLTPTGGIGDEGHVTCLDLGSRGADPFRKRGQMARKINLRKALGPTLVIQQQLILREKWIWLPRWAGRGRANLNSDERLYLQ